MSAFNILTDVLWWYLQHGSYCSRTLEVILHIRKISHNLRLFVELIYEEKAEFLSEIVTDLLLLRFFDRFLNLVQFVTT